MRDEYDETPEPAALWMQLQREQAAQRNFVTPAPLATRQPAESTPGLAGDVAAG